MQLSDELGVSRGAFLGDTLEDVKVRKVLRLLEEVAGLWCGREEVIASFGIPQSRVLLQWREKRVSTFPPEP